VPPREKRDEPRQEQTLGRARLDANHAVQCSSRHARLTGDLRAQRIALSRADALRERSADEAHGPEIDLRLWWICASPMHVVREHDHRHEDDRDGVRDQPSARSHVSFDAAPRPTWDPKVRSCAKRPNTGEILG
jgi:hypothetical protein